MELKLLLNISLFYADKHMCDYHSMVIKFQSPSQLKKLEEKYLVPLGGVCSGQVGGVVGSCDWDWEASSTKSSMMIWQLSLRPPILLLGIKSLFRWISMFWLALLHSASICEIHCQKDEKYWILMVHQPLVEYAIRAEKIQISAFRNS